MAEGDAAAGHIQLKVKDQQGSEVQFKIKKSTPLRKLMDAYCSRLGLQASQVRFMVDGERIAPDDTAEKLGLEDEDLIDVAMEQTGGAEGDAAAGHIQLKVKDQQGSEVQFKIKKSTPLRKLMDAYCSRLGLQASQVRFMVDGERIAPDDTAEKLGLEDEDLIDVAMEQTGGAEGDAAAGHIQLKVKDQQGSEVQFKIKKSTPLRKLMDAYCSRLGLQASQVRFMVDGERIAPDDTAEKLGLEDEDLIDVAMEQTGGAEGDAAAGHIQLKVKDQQGSEVQFKIKKSTPLRKLMDAYCSRLGLQASQVRFMVDGERIAPDDTAEKLGLEDEDLIDVAMEQTGGAEGDAAAGHIQLKVKDQQGSEVQFKIKKSTPLRKLMDAYCSRLGLQASQVRFMVDGERIAPDDTAEKLGLEDEDLIDVAMEQTGGAEGDAAAGHIQLKVKDQQGSEVQFKIKKSTPLRKLMDAYCSRLGLQASQVRFMVDGERIAPDDTAEKLGLEDEDLIDVAMEQTGGAEGDAAAGHIQLKVKDQQGSEVQFKIKKSTPLRKLMDAYCSRLGLQASQVRFMVDGERIAPDDTAEKLGLEDEDLIDVAMEQTGGR